MKNGNRIWIKGSTHHAKDRTFEETRKEVRFGGNFDKVSNSVAREYEKKGYSKEHADRIGRETAGKIYQEKRKKAGI